MMTVLADATVLGIFASIVVVPLGVFFAWLTTRKTSRAEKDKTLMDIAREAFDLTKDMYEEQTRLLRHDLDAAKATAQWQHALSVDNQGRIALLEQQHEECKRDLASTNREVVRLRKLVLLDKDGPTPILEAP